MLLKTSSAWRAPHLIPAARARRAPRQPHRVPQALPPCRPLQQFRGSRGLHCLLQAPQQPQGNPTGTAAHSACAQLCVSFPGSASKCPSPHNTLLSNPASQSSGPFPYKSVPQHRSQFPVNRSGPVHSPRVLFPLLSPSHGRCRRAEG